jgi:hypothetical protein
MQLTCTAATPMQVIATFWSTFIDEVPDELAVFFGFGKIVYTWSGANDVENKRRSKVRGVGAIPWGIVQ